MGGVLVSVVSLYTNLRRAAHALRCPLICIHRCARRRTLGRMQAYLLLEDVTVCGEVLWSSYTGSYPNKNAASFAVGIWALRVPNGAMSCTKEMHLRVCVAHGRCIYFRV